MRALLILCLALAACGDGNSDNNQCACTVQIGDAGLSLACGQQGCLGGYSYGCDNDEVIQISACDTDFAVEPVRNDAGVGVCLAARASCTSATLPCCTTDGGTAPTCDPATLVCCVATGQACTTSSDCCDSHSCVPTSGGAVCGS